VWVTEAWELATGAWVWVTGGSALATLLARERSPAVIWIGWRDEV